MRIIKLNSQDNCEDYIKSCIDSIQYNIWYVVVVKTGWCFTHLTYIHTHTATQQVFLRMTNTAESSDEIMWTFISCLCPPNPCLDCIIFIAESSYIFLGKQNFSLFFPLAFMSYELGFSPNPLKRKQKKQPYCVFCQELRSAMAAFRVLTFWRG